MGGIITQKRSARTPRTSESEDRLLGGAVCLRQPRQGYRAAIDPVFLAASVPARRGERVLELGVGSGAAALCLAHRVPGCGVTGLERQRDVAALAARNVARLCAQFARLSRTTPCSRSTCSTRTEISVFVK